MNCLPIPTKIILAVLAKTQKDQTQNQEHTAVDCWISETIRHYGVQATCIYDKVRVYT